MSASIPSDSAGSDTRAVREELASHWAIACLSHLPWQETLLQRPHQWMRRFARICPTVWIAPASWRQFRRSVPDDRRLRRSVTTADGVVVRQLNYTPGSGRFEWALRSTCRRMARAADALLARVPLVAEEEARHLLAWVQHPALGEAAAGLGPDAVVADVMDPYRAFAGNLRTGAEAARQCLAAASLVVAGGHSMGLDAARETGRAVLTVPSGVETAHFQQAIVKRRRLAKMPDAPVFGYVGSIDERIDMQLIVSLARRFPAVRFEFVGPVRLHALPDLPPNLVLCGGVSYGELPGVMAPWSGALLPFHDDALCRDLSPTKTPEYLAAGLPVIATPLPDLVTDWGDCCLLARTEEDWVGAIGRVLEGAAQHPPDLEERLRAADWDARFDTILEALGRVILGPR